jgi:hypothetical protein
LAIIAACLVAVVPLYAQEQIETAAVEEVPTEVHDRYGDVVSVFSGDVHVPAHTRQHGTVVCIGGHALIEGEVTEDVVVILGSLENRGKIGRAVTGVLTDQEHRDATVGRELVSVLGSVDLENTRVSRELFNILGSFRRDERSSAPSVNIGFGTWFPDLASMIIWMRLLRLFFLFVLLLILAALVPERIRAVGEEAPVRYALAFFVGLLGYIGLLIVLGLLTVTVIGLPIAIFAFVVFKWMGIAGIFFAIGRRLGHGLHREMSLLGAVMLTFGLYALITLLPTALGVLGLLVSFLIGTMFFVLVEVPAVGLVLLTRAGGRAGRVAPVAPPPASVPPPAPRGD